MNERLRIAAWHDLPSGGGRRALIDHLDGLADRGHTIRVWSTPQDAGPLRLASRDITQVVRPIPEPGSRSAQLRRVVPQLLLAEPPAAAMSMRAHASTVAPEIRSWEPDIVFINSSIRVGMASIANALPDLPTLAYLQEPYRLHYEDLGSPAWSTALPAPNSSALSRLAHAVKDLYRGQRTRALVAEERRSARAGTVLLANIYISRESIRRAYGVSSRVCYLGVDGNRFAALGITDTSDPYVVSLGQLSDHKRPGLVLEALGRIPDAPRLVWIGNTADLELMDRLRARAAELGVKLEMRLDVSDNDLVQLLSGATAHVYAPSLEPFGFAPIEAALCGTPTVGVYEGGVRETVEDGVTGLLAGDDPEELATALRCLLEDPTRAGALGRQAREVALAKWDLATGQDRLEAELIRAIGKFRGPESSQP